VIDPVTDISLLGAFPNTGLGILNHSILLSSTKALEIL
jgi:hypothetical protein